MIQKCPMLVLVLSPEPSICGSEKASPYRLYTDPENNVN
jgi:hypothetical protein